MDLFDTKRDGWKAMKPVLGADMSDIHLNYQTLDYY